MKATHKPLNGYNLIRIRHRFTIFLLIENRHIVIFLDGFFDWHILLGYPKFCFY